MKSWTSRCLCLFKRLLLPECFLETWPAEPTCSQLIWSEVPTSPVREVAASTMGVFKKRARSSERFSFLGASILKGHHGALESTLESNNFLWVMLSYSSCQVIKAGGSSREFIVKSTSSSSRKRCFRKYLWVKERTLASAPWNWSCSCRYWVSLF